MQASIHPEPVSCGAAAAAEAATILRAILAERARAHLVVATGASQFETLKALTREPGIDWTRVVAFHLDEYVGLPDSHPASFRRYRPSTFSTTGRSGIVTLFLATPRFRRHCMVEKSSMRSKVFWKRIATIEFDHL